MAPAPVAAAWAFASSHGATTYETVLYRDGTLSCHCPGWAYKCANRPRGCRHTRAVSPYTRELLGGRLTAEEAGARAGALPPHPFAAIEAAHPAAHSRPRPASLPAAVSPLTGHLRRQLDLR